MNFKERKRDTISQEFKNEFYKLDYIHNYILNIMNHIPKYVYGKPKQSKRLIKEYMLKNKYDEYFTEEINNDFCEGFGCAVDLIFNEFLSDIHEKYELLKRERMHEHSN